MSRLNRRLSLFSKHFTNVHKIYFNVRYKCAIIYTEVREKPRTQNKKVR
nr:MAG TPA: hypothetical protein [Caudoviricetes sp.]